jgi:hypothetical protein
MRRTIYLPDDLNERVESYLRDHPATSFSALVRELLEQRIRPRDLSGLLELAGIIKEVNPRTPEQPEDQVVDRIG